MSGTRLQSRMLLLSGELLTLGKVALSDMLLVCGSAASEVTRALGVFIFFGGMLDFLAYGAK